MGIGIEIGCRGCNYSSKMINIGIGEDYFPRNFIDLDSEGALLPRLIQSKKTLDHIRELLSEKKAVEASDCSHKICRCAKCGKFYGRFFIRFDYEGGSYEVNYKCPACKTALKPIEGDLNLEQYPCPKCGKHSLYICGGMDWD